MKILVVDEDAESRDALKELLEAAPEPNEEANEVRAAANGDEALELAQEWGGVDLLITEIFMEQQNGFTLRNKMENRFAGMKTIFVTGYDVSGYEEHCGGCEVVPKPVDAQTLFEAI